MDQLDLFGEPKKSEPAVQEFPKHDKTAESEIEKMKADGWVFGLIFKSNLFDKDELPEQIERTFIQATSPEGDFLQLVWDFDTGGFFTQGELEFYLFGKPNNPEDEW